MLNGFYLLNMDTQDRQDKQHERLRHRKQTRSMIGWVLEVIQEPGSGFWEIRVGTEAMVELMTVENSRQIILCILCIHVN